MSSAPPPVPSATPPLTRGLPLDWLPQLRGGLARAPIHDPEQWRMFGRRLIEIESVRDLVPAAPHPAAVLVPIVDRPDGPTLLLTTRAGHLRTHAGQISFPGGRLEVDDATVLDAALRETQEEIGLEPGFVELLGFLPDHFVLTGYRITPVVALVRPGFELRVDAAEVAEVFELPLRLLADPGNFLLTRREVHGVDVMLHDLHFEGRIIWGATSGMLQVLGELLASGERLVPGA